MATLTDRLIRHKIFVQRLAATQANAIKAYLNTVKKVAKEGVTRGIHPSVIKVQLKHEMSGFTTTMIDNLTDFAEYESKFFASQVSKALGTDVAPIELDVLKDALKKTSMGVNLGDASLNNKRTLDGVYNEYARRKNQEILQIIKDGELKSSDKERVLVSLDERVAGLMSAQARSLAVTTTNFAATVAKLETLASTDIEKETWVSVLDDATTDYCEEEDGNIYDVGDGPYPPAHWGCRSERVPYIEEQV